VFSSSSQGLQNHEPFFGGILITLKNKTKTTRKQDEDDDIETRRRQDKTTFWYFFQTVADLVHRNIAFFAKNNQVVVEAIPIQAYPTRLGKG
jgi:hypothetical protein